MNAAASKKTETKAKATDEVEEKVEEKVGDHKCGCDASINDRLNKLWLDLETEYDRDDALVSVLNDLTALQLRIKALDN